MLTTLIEFPVTTGMMTEIYSLERDNSGDGTVQLFVVLDAENGGPCDSVPIDPLAFAPLAAAFAALERQRAERSMRTVVPSVVVDFPFRKLVPGQAREATP